MQLDEELPKFNRPFSQPAPINVTEVKERSDKGKHRNKYDSKLNPKYKSYLMRCNKKGIFMELTEIEFLQFIKQDCYYCGSHHNIGIDRISSKGSYIKDNIRPCCPKCNMMKYTHSEEEFISHIQRIIKHRYNI